MGTSHIAFKYLINNLGFEAVDPPKPNTQTLNLGSKYSPEFACMPFKLLTGSYLQVLEQGTELIITSGGIGPCRAGLYGVLHQKILKDMGYDVDFIIFEPPLWNLYDFIKKLRHVMHYNKTSWRQLVKVASVAWDKLKAIDEIEIKSYEVRPYELHRGDTTRVYEDGLVLIDRAQTHEEIKEALRDTLHRYDAIEKDLSRCPLKVGIVGEIYVILEPFMNMEIQRILGEMGVYAHRTLYLTAWTRDNLLNGKGELNIKKAAQPYLDQMVGGHGQVTVGESVLYAKKGFDGVVHVGPFGCLPEIVAESVLTRISQDFDLPIINFTMDEQTGLAGIETRLEAFVDLMEQKRMVREGKSGAWLFGY